MKKIKKKIIFISLLLAIIVLSAVKLYNTYATGESQNANDTYTFDLTGDTTVTLAANERKTFIYQIKNTNDGTVNYAVGYSSENQDTKVKVYYDSTDPTSGTIASNDYKYIKLRVINNSNTIASISLSTILGYENGGELILPSGVTKVTEVVYVASNYISNLYTGAEKSTVTANNITYNLATSVNLMNDRLGDSSTGIDDGNIRYYGANPNNYVDIGDRTSNDKVILWRIIGVFDGKLRIVRNETIGKYPYDTSASTVNSGQGVNEWSQADSMKLLNPEYDSELIGGSLWYKGGSGSCYFGQNNGTTECDFTSTGLSNKSKDYITDQTVYLGSGDNNLIYPDQAYIMERGNTTRTCTDVKVCNDTVERTSSWTGKVALMYPSDYGYAVDLSLCKKTLSAYNDSTCINNNWLKTPIGWLMTPYTSDYYRMWAVINAGSVSRGRAYYSDYNVRPVVTLKANIIFESGAGTSTDPFVVA